MSKAQRFEFRGSLNQTHEKGTAFSDLKPQRIQYLNGLAITKRTPGTQPQASQMCLVKAFGEDTCPALEAMYINTA